LLEVFRMGSIEDAVWNYKINVITLDLSQAKSIQTAASLTMGCKIPALDGHCYWCTWVARLSNNRGTITKQRLSLQIVHPGITCFTTFPLRYILGFRSTPTQHLYGFLSCCPWFKKKINNNDKGFSKNTSLNVVESWGSEEALRTVLFVEGQCCFWSIKFLIETINRLC
jgi:hypothetical protein